MKNHFKLASLFILGMFSFLFCTNEQSKASPGLESDISKTNFDIKDEKDQPIAKMDTATFAAGCFWCVEEHFKELEGVKEVTSGYIGDAKQKASYKLVSAGSTNHAEACLVVFDATKITYDQLLEVFFFIHDPTQLNKQGNDVGKQYRSAIFYHDEKQKQKADYYIKKLNEEKVYDSNVVTELSPFSIFYKAEAYHQDYYKNNPENPYCEYVIRPKLEKFRMVFKHQLKK